MTQSESPTIGKLAEALAKAQAQMGPAIKGAKNPFFKSTYAKLEDVIAAVRGPLTDNGLSYVQPIEEEGDHTYVITKLMHVSGEWIAGRMKLIPGKKDMQSQGSAITYAKRFSLSAMVGLAEEDDDGSEASKPPDQPIQPPKTVVSINPMTPIKPVAPIDPNSPSVQTDERFKRTSGMREHLGWSNHDLDVQIKKIAPGKILSTLTQQEYIKLVYVMEVELQKLQIK